MILAGAYCSSGSVCKADRQMSLLSMKHYIKVIILSLFVLAALVLAVLSHPAFGTFRHVSKERIQASPNYRDGMFQNQEPTPQFTGKSPKTHPAPQKGRDKNAGRKPQTPIEAYKTDLKSLPTDSDWVVWFGHSSYLFCLGGKRILVDPLLKPEFPASVMLRPFPGTDIYRPEDLPRIDVLIITHEHWDHMDYATLRELNALSGSSVEGEKMKVFCPLGIADYLRYWGYKEEQITEMDWGEEASLGFSVEEGRKDDGLRVTCLPSRHFSNRLLGKANQTLWASFMVECAGKKVYIGGDGGYDKRFKAIREQFGQVDLAFIENGQYNERWRYIHTMPEDLPKVIEDLQPKQVFTVHHDKFALAMHPWNEPDSVARAVSRELSAISIQPSAFRLLDAPIGKVVPF